MVRIENVSKYFGNNQVLKNVSLDIEDGTIYGIIGYSGAGKSTLIRLINGLEKPTSGKIIINDTDINSMSDKDLRDKKKEIGMIFQHPYLLNSKTVFDNVALPLKLTKNKYSKEETNKKVTDILKFVSLEDKIASYPDQLSGGEKQRVGIARALINNPEILLSDEATSALDPETTKQILDLINKINKELGVTIILITHQMEVIKHICDNVAVIEHGEILEKNDIFNIFAQPEKETTKKFVSDILHQNISKSIFKYLENGILYKLTFLGATTTKAVLSEITKKTGITISILQGVATEIQNQFLGQLVVRISDNQKERELFLKELDIHKVSYEELREEILI